MKILIPSEVTSAGLDFLKENGYEIVKPKDTSEDEIIKAIKDCDGLLARTEKITRKILEAGENLKVIGRHGVGYDTVDLEACEELGIYVTNAPISNMISVAEHTLALILALAKKIVDGSNAQKDGDFDYRNREILEDLEGKSIAIIGLGRIGRKVAKMCHFGFDMTVLGYDPYVTESDDFIEVKSTLEDAIKDADFVSLHMPSTKDNARFFDKKYFDIMKNTAYFINCARGEVVNEDDLILALKNNSIKGCGLDVFEIEPPLKENELFTLKNVIVTPHNAALTKESKDRMGLHAALGIYEVLSGKDITYPVLIPKNPKK